MLPAWLSQPTSVLSSLKVTCLDWMLTAISYDHALNLSTGKPILNDCILILQPSTMHSSDTVPSSLSLERHRTLSHGSGSSESTGWQMVWIANKAAPEPRFQLSPLCRMTVMISFTKSSTHPMSSSGIMTSRGKAVPNFMTDGSNIGNGIIVAWGDANSIGSHSFSWRMCLTGQWWAQSSHTTQQGRVCYWR